ncbi:MAG: glycosyltransferase family 4 protein [Acidobacteriota bacterium]
MTTLIPLPYAALLCFFTALVFALAGTPLAARAAVRFGIVDKPGGDLKRHRRPTPYLGGLAVYASFILTMGLAFDFDRRVLGLLLAGSVLVLLGLIDDFGVLGVWPKFLGQGFATLILIKSGIAIQIGALSPWCNTLLTVIWIIGLTNAFNIIDVMDGLATGTAILAGVFLLVVSLLNQQASITLITATLIGSLLGFLCYNAHPASIFMGDTGSLFIGMMLGSLAMIGKYDHVNPIGYLTPLLILAVPIFDTLYVMTLRVARGRNPFRGSPDHFALRLEKLGLKVPAVVGLTWGAGVVLGGLALVNLELHRAGSILLVSGCAGALALVGWVLARAGKGRDTAQSPVPRQLSPEEIRALQQREQIAVQVARQNLALWRRR